MSRILVTGSSSGLGKLLCGVLDAAGHDVFQFDKEHGHDVRSPVKEAIAESCDNRLDVLINCAGINRIDWCENVTSSEWDLVMDTNAKGIFMMTQAVLPMLKKSRGSVLNIVSNASHMPMTCSAAYGASKGAAHILTLQLARELTKRFGITVFGISPNKLAGTGMSKDIDDQVVVTRGWTAEAAHAYQLQGLLCGEETDPLQLAEFIGYLLYTKSRHKFLTGCVVPYGA